MTVRKQLELQLAAIRVVWAMTPPAPVPRVGEVALECQVSWQSLTAIRGVGGRINASAIFGAGAGYLLARAVTIDAASGGAGYRVVVRIAYRERPWVGTAADFGALLEALEAGAGPEPDAPPERPKTWRELPPLL
jgi:hypothetical protein